MTKCEWDHLSATARFALIGTPASPYWLGGTTPLLVEGHAAFIGPIRPPHGMVEVEVRTISASPGPLFVLTVAAGLSDSRNAARRLIEGGGVLVDGERVTNPLAELALPVTLRIGKRGEPVRVCPP